MTGLQGKGEGIPLTPHYHFCPLHRHLDISRAITADSSPLHIASSRTRTANLWFPSASRKPLSYVPKVVRPRFFENVCISNTSVFHHLSLSLSLSLSYSSSSSIRMFSRRSSRSPSFSRSSWLSCHTFSKYVRCSFSNSLFFLSLFSLSS